VQCDIAVFRWAQHGIPHIAIGTGSRCGMTHTASLAQVGTTPTIRTIEQISLMRKVSPPRTVFSIPYERASA